MIATIVPAHNEEADIGACIDSVHLAQQCPLLCGEPGLLVVVLDDCTDSTGDVARALGAHTLVVSARNVGAARRLGAAHALKAGARWLSFTDADSVVAPDWLSSQLALRSDVVCGTVAVNDWGTYGAPMQQHYAATYNDADGHRHIHGANLGVSAAAYRRAGGFAALTSSEDVALVQALQRCGAQVAWSARPRVVTSARRSFRAPAGFGATLERIEADAQAQVELCRSTA